MEIIAFILLAALIAAFLYGAAHLLLSLLALVFMWVWPPSPEQTARFVEQQAREAAEARQRDKAHRARILAAAIATERRRLGLTELRD